MKTKLFSSRALWPVLFLLVVSFSGGLPARAGLTINLLMYHTVAGVSASAGYDCDAYLITNSTPPLAPLGGYVMSSPTNAWHTEYQLTGTSFSNPVNIGHYYPDFNSFIQQLTNGNWTIVFTNATTTNVYAFTVSAPGFTSNVFSVPVVVSFPTNGEVNVTNQPIYTWQGPSSWGVNPYVQEADYPAYSSVQNASLSPPQTSWSSPMVLSNGTYQLFVQYASNATPAIVASTPLDTHTAAPISGWTSIATLESYQFINFSVTNATGGGGLTLGTALNAPGLTWITNGNTGWYPETTNYYEDGAAAQSGIVTGGNTSTLQTTVTGPGTLTFWWKTSASDYDFDVEFDLDGNDYDDNNLYNGGVWNQETAVFIPAGEHPISWTAYGADYASDAGYLDEVQFTPGAPPLQVSFSLSISRQQGSRGNLAYDVVPYISSISPAPVTTSLIDSPDAKSYSEVFTGDSSDNNGGYGWPYGSLDDAIYACTNGPWTLTINQGDPSQQVFQFSVSLNSLTTSLLAPVNILVPTNNAVNVPTNSPFQWSGPANYTYITTYAYQLPSYNYIGSASLSESATNWPSPPLLPYGTNDFSVTYVTYPSTNFAFTTPVPVDANTNLLSSWNPAGELYTLSDILFVVGAPAPLPVKLSGTPPQSNGGSFQLLFQTLTGRPETIQMSTNLTSGLWTDVTNFIGDGASHQFSFPTTNASGKYFRVKTQ